MALSKPRWWNGRHAVLRGPWAFARVGSSPALGTSQINAVDGNATGRRSQVVKAEVCKTSIRRFESARRLQSPPHSDRSSLCEKSPTPHRAAPLSEKALRVPLTERRGGEKVDAADLKSATSRRCVGSIPSLGTIPRPDAVAGSRHTRSAAPPPRCRGCPAKAA